MSKFISSAYYLRVAKLKGAKSEGKLLVFCYMLLVLIDFCLTITKATKYMSYSNMKSIRTDILVEVTNCQTFCILAATTEHNFSWFGVEFF